MLPKITQRVISGVGIGAATVAGIFLAPPWVMWLVLMALCIVSAMEFYAMLDAVKIPNFNIMGMLGGILLITATCYTLQPGNQAFAGEVDALAIFFLTVGVFLRQFPQKNNPQPLETVAGTLLGFFYVAFLLNFIAKALFTWGDWEGRLLVFYMIMVVKFTDIGAFFVGCSVGRHKLIPRISPGKTWEGVLGGVFSGWLVSLLFLFVTKGQWGHLHMTLLDACALGFLLPCSGVLGDLTESLFKRAAGVKDSSRLVSGMGGFLDVLDSLLFSAPVIYFYARFFM